MSIDEIRMLLTDFAKRLIQSNGADPTKVQVGINKVGRLLAAHLVESSLKGVPARCTACPIHAEEPDALQHFGSGNPSADVVLVGQGAGETEGQYGLPFVGIAGTLLTMALEDAGLPRETVWLSNTVKCLWGTTNVYLADGSLRPIASLVAEKYDGEVLSLSPSGHVVPRRVVGWYRSPLAGRRLFKVTHSLAKGNSKGTVGFIATEDHPVLTQRGWVPVGQLAPSDFICTNELLPAPRQYQLLLVAMFLGDGAVNKRTKTQLTFAHSDSQLGYLQYKHRLLSTLGVSPIKQVISSGYTSYRFHVRALRALLPLWEKSIVDIVSMLDTFGLACWFMDDGYMRCREDQNRQPRAELAVTRLSPTEVDQIIQIIRSKWQLNPYRYDSPQGPRIMFNVQETAKLSRLIAPYVPPCMRYKLRPEDRNVPFDSNAWAPEQPGLLYAPVRIEPYHPARPKPVYCIDVEETANFITPGGVVHNCRPKDNRAPAREETRTCISLFLEREINIIRPKVIVALGASALQSLVEPSVLGTSKISQHRGNWFTTTFAGRQYPVLATYHPAYIVRQRGQRFQELYQVLVDDLKKAAVGCQQQPLCAAISQ